MYEARKLGYKMNHVHCKRQERISYNRLARVPKITPTVYEKVIADNSIRSASISQHRTKTVGKLYINLPQHIN